MLDTSDLSYEDFIPSMGASVSPIDVGLSPTVLLEINSKRRALMLYNTGSPVYITFGMKMDPDYYSYVVGTNKLFYIDHYGGILSGVCKIGTSTVMVSELF